MPPFVVMVTQFTEHAHSCRKFSFVHQYIKVKFKQQLDVQQGMGNGRHEYTFNLITCLGNDSFLSSLLSVSVTLSSIPCKTATLIL